MPLMRNYAFSSFLSKKKIFFSLVFKLENSCKWDNHIELFSNSKWTLIHRNRVISIKVINNKLPNYLKVKQVFSDFFDRIWTFQPFFKFYMRKYCLSETAVIIKIKGINPNYLLNWMLRWITSNLKHKLKK